MTSEAQPVGNDPNILGSGTHVDHEGPPEGETAFEHYGDVPDPRASSDPSSPQGGFWKPEEANRVAEEIAAVPLDESHDAHRHRPSGAGEEEE